MTKDTDTPTDEPSDDKIEALEARVAELEAMTEVDSDADGGVSLPDLLDFGLTRRQALMAIALVGAGYSLGPAITKSISEPAAASHGGATLGTADNPLSEIYVHDLYNTTDNIVADSVTTDEATINGNQVYVQPGQPADLSNAVWLDSDAQPFSSVKASLSTIQTITAGVSTLTVEFDQELRDKRNEYDGTTFQFTADDAGLYRISGQLNVRNHGSGDRFGSFVYVNGGSVNRVVRDVGVTGAFDYPLPDTIRSLSAGDTVEIQFRNETNDCEITADSEQTFVDIQRVD